MADPEGWVQGDGGPIVVLQASAATAWRGAAGTDPRPRGGSAVETDYDAIGRCDDGVTVLERHGRAMLVLSDSSWPARFVSSPRGEVVIAQPIGVDESPDAWVAKVTSRPPAETRTLTLLDDRLRLLVGADDGAGGTYGFAETRVTPGEKACEVWWSREGFVVVLRPIGRRGPAIP